MKLGTTKKGWTLLRVFTVRCEPARFWHGRLPTFEPSRTDAGGVVMQPGGWRGGTLWPSSVTTHPVWVGQGVV